MPLSTRPRLPPHLARPGRGLALCLLMLGTAAACLSATAPASAQSIGDWNGTYRAPAAKQPPAKDETQTASPAPRIDTVPVIPARPHAESHPAARPSPVRPASVTHAPVTHAPVTHAPVTHAASRATPPAHPAMQAVETTPVKPVVAPSSQPIIAAPTAKPTPAPMASASTAAVQLAHFPPPRHIPKPAPPPLAPKSQDLPQWPLGLAALLGGAAGWALWRRKGSVETQAEQDETPAPADLPPAAPHVSAAVVMAAAAEPVTSPLPPVGEPIIIPPAAPDLSFEFVPTRFTTTLAEAILRYRITIINRSPEPLGPLVIAGAMEALGAGQTPDASPEPHDRPFRPASGFNPHPHFTPQAELHEHIDLPGEPQPLFPARAAIVPVAAPTPAETAAPEPAPPPECHRLDVLRAGEGADFAGQMRLPLADIAPIRVGNAALFVPVVRLTMQAEALSGMIITRDLCLMVGEAGPEDIIQTGGEPSSLAPLRLDADATTTQNLAQNLATRAMPLAG